MKFSPNPTYDFDGEALPNYRLETPDICPRCHKGIEPVFVSFARTQQFEGTATYYCKGCKSCFLADYHLIDIQRTSLSAAYPLQFSAEDFSEIIDLVSPDFVKIFNQAKQADTEGLDQIAGVGYRKALEFLIKDYAILLNNGKEAEISKIKDMSLAQCIDKFVEHPRMKSISKRATWLGNDETHYIKKYEDEDTETLKSLINLSVSWISLDIESRYLEEKINHPSQLEKKSQD